MNNSDIYLPLTMIWAALGLMVFGIFWQDVRRLPQRIFLSTVCGPFIWVGWLVRWFFQWLLAK